MMLNPHVHVTPAIFFFNDDFYQPSDSTHRVAIDLHLLRLRFWNQLLSADSHGSLNQLGFSYNHVVRFFLLRFLSPKVPPFTALSASARLQR